MRGYTTREVADLLNMTQHKVRTFARSGLLAGNRDENREYRYSFEDIVLIRTAENLAASGIHPRKVWSALRSLRQQLPQGRPLTSVRVIVEGDRVLVKERTTTWHPDSGQLSLTFSVDEAVNQVAPLVRSEARSAHDNKDLTSDDWYALGLDLELISAVEDARAAYRIAVEFDPDNADAHLNLGRLLQEMGQSADAEPHYRKAVELKPGNAVAAYNLGTALEDLGRPTEAVIAYRRAIELRAEFAEAHLKLSRLYEKRGNRVGALRHLVRYKALAGIP